MIYSSLFDFSGFGLTGIGSLWIAVHLLGLLTAWMVQMQNGKRYELFVQSGFFTSLLAVAGTTVIGHVYCLAMWPLSAITMALMIVLAIADLGAANTDAFTLDG